MGYKKVLVVAAVVRERKTKFHSNPSTCESILKQSISQRELRVARSDQVRSGRTASQLIKQVILLWGVDS